MKMITGITPEGPIDIDCCSARLADDRQGEGPFPFLNWCILKLVPQHGPTGRTGRIAQATGTSRRTRLTIHWHPSQYAPSWPSSVGTGPSHTIIARAN